MEKRVNKVYFLIPLIYIAAIFLLLMLQFSGGRSLKINSGNLFLRGNLSVANETTTIADLAVEFGGIQFPFNPDQPLEVETRAGKVYRERLVGYATLDNGFELEFGENARLQFVTDGQNGMEVHPVLPRTMLPLAKITMPFGLRAATLTKPDKNIPVYSVINGNTEYLLTLPSRSEISANKDQIVLYGNNEQALVRYVVAPPETKDFFAVWFENQDVHVSQTDYDNAVKAYLDAAYAGWSRRRYNPTAGTWSTREGAQEFDEEILTAYLAEAWRRDDYPRAFTEMRTAADKHPGDLTYLSSVYLGNLIEMSQKLVDSDRREATRLSGLASRDDRELFRSPHAVRFAADRAPATLLVDLERLAAKVDATDVEIPTALGMLQNAVDARTISPEVGQAFERFFDVAARVIIPNIVKTDQGFFVQTRPGRIELYYSAEAGALLQSVGDIQKDEKLVLMGRNLVMSAMDFADADGFIPQILFFDETTIKESQGSIGPESLYPLVASNNAYPREISLYASAGQGIWMWTIMGISDIRINATEWRISLKYPPNRTQYLMMQGVPSFKEMYLFGFEDPWRADPRFESYSKGRYYVPSTKSLLIKYYDDSAAEDIVIRY